MPMIGNMEICTPAIFLFILGIINTVIGFLVLFYAPDKLGDQVGSAPSAICCQFLCMIALGALCQVMGEFGVTVVWILFVIAAICSVFSWFNTFASAITGSKL